MLFLVIPILIMYQKVYITVYTHVLMYMLISFWLGNAEKVVSLKMLLKIQPQKYQPVKMQ